MIVVLAQWLDWLHAHRLWLASLAAAAAINLVFLWLASVAPLGHLAGLEAQRRETPVEIVFRRRVPPPPDMSALGPADAPPSAMPPRFNPKSPAVLAVPNLARDTVLPPPRLRLNLSPCDPEDDEALRRPDCAPPQEWLRADRDASALLGSNAQGFTLDEAAVARGWLKPKARTGQDAMAAETDATLPQTIFKDAPFPPHAIERSGGW